MSGRSASCLLFTVAFAVASCSEHDVDDSYTGLAPDGGGGAGARGGAPSSGGGDALGSGGNPCGAPPVTSDQLQGGSCPGAPGDASPQGWAPCTEGDFCYSGSGSDPCYQPHYSTQYCVHYGDHWFLRSNNGQDQVPVVPAGVGDDHCATAPGAPAKPTDLCSTYPGLGFSHDAAAHTCRLSCATDPFNFFPTKADCEGVCGPSRDGGASSDAATDARSPDAGMLDAAPRVSDAQPD